MSEIRATTISDAAGTGPIDLHKQSAAKLWVHFDGTGTATIKDSLNTASITDHGVGDFTVNISNSMASANYSMTGTCGSTVTTSTAPAVVRPAGVNTASAFRSRHLYASGSTNSVGDYSVISNTVQGDLA